ncbi:MAG: PAS domain S-box protein [Myxococcales bacterium]|nr:PAS domain S-box protein [Myxococcales bacterium]
MEGVPPDRVAALLVISVLAAIAFVRRPVRPLAVVLLGVLWAADSVVLGDLGRAVSSRTWSARLSDAAFYSGVIFLPPLLLLLAKRYASFLGHHLLRVSRSWARLPLLLAFGLWLLMLTNPWHHQFLLPLSGGGESYRWGWWLQAVIGSLWVAASLLLYGVVLVRNRGRGGQRALFLMWVAPIPAMIAALGSEPSVATSFDPVIIGVTIAAVLYTGGVYSGIFRLQTAGWFESVRHDTDGMVVLDPQGRIVYSNPACAGFMDVRELRPNVDFWRLLAAELGHPSDPRGVIDPRKLAQMLTDPSLSAPADGPVYRYGPERDRWLRIEPTRILNRFEAVRGYALRLRDVTVEQLSAQELRASEGKYRALVETANDVIWSMDADGKLNFVNQAVRAHMGFAPEEMIGHSFLEFVAERDRARLRGEFARIEELPLDPGFEMNIVHKGGSLVHLLVNAVVVRDPAGEIVGLTGTAWDTTEQRRMTEMLRGSEERYQQILAKARFGVLVSGEGHILFSNAAAVRITGYSEEELRTLSLLDLVAPAERERLSLLEAARQRGESVGFEVYELLLVRKDGEPCWVEVSAFPLEYGSRWALMLQLVDITERRRAEKARDRLEAQVRQAQKLEAIGTLAGGIAHDFNNLLTGVIGSLELARLQLEPGVPVLAELREAEVNAERAASLARQLLSFSRPQLSASFRAARIETVFESLSSMLRASIPATIALRTSVASETPPIRCDSGLLEQALLNLGINARDAMPGGGELSFDAEAIEVCPGDACLQTGGRPGRFARIRVRDTGEGIMPEALDRIYDPFYTTKDPGKGTGLGLAMVYGCMQAHAGWISAESAPGRGSSFELYLPLASASEAAPEPPVETELGAGTGTVLFVDDARGVLEVGAKLLERMGYKVLTAADGIEALEVYRCWSGEIVAVVTDLIMPRMGGRELFAALRAADSQVPVVATSGYASGMQPQELLAEGFAGVLLKPFRRMQLREILHTVLSDSRPPGAGSIPRPAS